MIFTLICCGLTIVCCGIFCAIVGVKIKNQHRFSNEQEKFIKVVKSDVGGLENRTELLEAKIARFKKDGESLSYIASGHVTNAKLAALDVIPQKEELQKKIVANPVPSRHLSGKNLSGKIVPMRPKVMAFVQELLSISPRTLDELLDDVGRSVFPVQKSTLRDYLSKDARFEFKGRKWRAKETAPEVLSESTLSEVEDL